MVTALSQDAATPRVLRHFPVLDAGEVRNKKILALRNNPLFCPFGKLFGLH